MTCCPICPIPRNRVRRDYSTPGRAAWKCSSTTTRRADDKLPCSRFSSTRADERPHSQAASRRDFTQGLPERFLQAHAGLCPDTTTDRFGNGAGHPLRTVPLLVVHDRPRSQFALNTAIASSRSTAKPWCGPGGRRSWKRIVHIHGVSAGCPASARKMRPTIRLPS